MPRSVEGFVEIVDNIVRSKIKWEPKHKSFPAALVEILREDGTRIAMIDCDTGRQWTAKELLNAIETLAVKFTDYGVSKGDRVAFFCENSDLHLIAIMSFWFIGAVYTGLVEKSPLRELNNVIVKTSATFLIGSKKTLDDCKQYMSANASIKKFFLIEENIDKEVASIEALIKSKVGIEEKNKIYNLMASVESSDLSKIIFSSGTTGEPKPVTETQGRSYAYRGVSPPEINLVTKEDTVAILSPLQHTGASVFLALSLLTPAKLVLFSHFDCQHFLRNVQKYSITFAFIVPAYINLLNRTVTEPLHSFNLKKVISAGEFMPETSSKEFVEKYKPEYFGQGYGSTEAGWGTTVPVSQGVTELTTSGPPVSGYEFKIVDLNTGQALGANQKGEIHMRGPHTTGGYLNNEKANQESFDEQRFFKSGDIGFYDERGYIYCTDRIKEIIKYNSQQVSPSELQDILLQHESVKEAVVIGVEDKTHGQLPKAFVVLKDLFKGVINENDLLEYVACNVSDYKKLRGGLVFIDKLPKSSLGKIARHVLKSM